MKSFTLKSPLAGVVLTALLMASVTSGVSAQSTPAPSVTGTVRGASDAAWGTWEGFSTSSNTFGFFLRFRWNGNNVATVVPFETAADGKITCWWISYYLVGATDPNRTEGWQWVETASGRVILDPATMTSTSISGFMITLATGTQNHQRIPVQNPQWQPLKLTVP
jgi:hypothetical protein